MKWRLDGPHHIDEQVLPTGTVIGDDTPWPYRAPKDDPKIKRKKGDPLPPSNAMTPLDDDARKLFKITYGDDAPDSDPLKSIPLTGAPNAPKIAPFKEPQPTRQEPVNPAPHNTGLPTGFDAKKDG